MSNAMYKVGDWVIVKGPFNSRLKGKIILVIENGNGFLYRIENKSFWHSENDIMPDTDIGRLLYG